MSQIPNSILTNMPVSLAVFKYPTGHVLVIINWLSWHMLEPVCRNLQEKQKDKAIVDPLYYRPG